MSPPGEFELIRRYFTREPAAPGGHSGVVAGIGDDAALLRVPEGRDLVAAVDTIVEGRHFPNGSNPRSIGHRALAVNLSDFAAMGADPAWAMLALTMPRAEPEWLEAFAGGFHSLAGQHAVTLVGGDTTAGPLTISVQLLGHVPRGQALLRSGACAGDLLAVTGTLGDAAAGLALLQGALQVGDDAVATELRARFEYPTPRIEFGRAARALASAAMDLSDGLIGDLPKLTAASGVGAEVHLERLPLSSALLAGAGRTRALDWALGGGDDYELLLAVPAAHRAALAAAAADSGVNLSFIGRVGGSGSVKWLQHGRVFAPLPQGYDHFR